MAGVGYDDLGEFGAGHLPDLRKNIVWPFLAMRLFAAISLPCSTCVRLERPRRNTDPGSRRGQKDQAALQKI